MELNEFGDMKAALSKLEGEQIDSYEISQFMDSPQETATLKARPKNMDETVTWTVNYYRRDF